ncbi:hypothetical protein Tco_1034806 [Tanacetum coccineum]
MGRGNRRDNLRSPISPTLLKISDSLQRPESKGQFTDAHLKQRIVDFGVVGGFEDNETEASTDRIWATKHLDALSLFHCCHYLDVMFEMKSSPECCILFRTSMTSAVSRGCHADQEREYSLGTRAANITESHPMKLANVNVEGVYCSCGNRHPPETHVGGNRLSLQCPGQTFRQQKSLDLLMTCISENEQVDSNANQPRSKGFLFITEL